MDGLPILLAGVQSDPVSTHGSRPGRSVLPGSADDGPSFDDVLSTMLTDGSSPAPSAAEVQHGQSQDTGQSDGAVPIGHSDETKAKDEKCQGDGTVPPGSAAMATLLPATTWLQMMTSPSVEQTPPGTAENDRAISAVAETRLAPRTAQAASGAQPGGGMPRGALDVAGSANLLAGTTAVTPQQTTIPSGTSSLGLQTAVTGQHNRGGKGGRETPSDSVGQPSQPSMQGVRAGKGLESTVATRPDSVSPAPTTTPTAPGDVQGATAMEPAMTLQPERRPGAEPSVGSSGSNSGRPVAAADTTPAGSTRVWKPGSADLQPSTGRPRGSASSNTPSLHESAAPALTRARQARVDTVPSAQVAGQAVGAPHEVNTAAQPDRQGMLPETGLASPERINAGQSGERVDTERVSATIVGERAAVSVAGDSMATAASVRQEASNTAHATAPGVPSRDDRPVANGGVPASSPQPNTSPPATPRAGKAPDTALTSSVDDQLASATVTQPLASHGAPAATSASVADALGAVIASSQDSGVMRADGAARSEAARSAGTADRTPVAAAQGAPVPSHTADTQAIPAPSLHMPPVLQGDLIGRAALARPAAGGPSNDETGNSRVGGTSPVAARRSRQSSDGTADTQPQVGDREVLAPTPSTPSSGSATGAGQAGHAPQTAAGDHTAGDGIGISTAARIAREQPPAVPARTDAASQPWLVGRQASPALSAPVSAPAATTPHHDEAQRVAVHHGAPEASPVATAAAVAGIGAAPAQLASRPVTMGVASTPHAYRPILDGIMIRQAELQVTPSSARFAAVITPPALGSVTVHVERSEQGVQVVLRPATVAASHVLTAQAHDLAASLRSLDGGPVQVRVIAPEGAGHGLAGFPSDRQTAAFMASAPRDAVAGAVDALVAPAAQATSTATPTPAAAAPQMPDMGNMASGGFAGAQTGHGQHGGHGGQPGAWHDDAPSQGGPVSSAGTATVRPSYRPRSAGWHATGSHIDIEA